MGNRLWVIEESKAFPYHLQPSTYNLGGAHSPTIYFPFSLSFLAGLPVRSP